MVFYNFLFILRTSTEATGISSSTTHEYDDYEPLFSLGVRSGVKSKAIYSGVRSARQVHYKRLVKNDWEIRDIHCQGVPFTKLPGILFN